MARDPTATGLLQGTLDLLILKALQRGPVHGFGISVRIRQLSGEVLHVEQGSLYPALYWIEDRGWIKAEWGVSDNNRKARFYEFTAAGRKQLDAETANWKQVSAAINLVLRGCEKQKAISGKLKAGTPIPSPTTQSAAYRLPPNA